MDKNFIGRTKEELKSLPTFGLIGSGSITNHVTMIINASVK